METKKRYRIWVKGDEKTALKHSKKWGVWGGMAIREKDNGTTVIDFYNSWDNTELLNNWFTAPEYTSDPPFSPGTLLFWSIIEEPVTDKTEIDF